MDEQCLEDSTISPFEQLGPVNYHNLVQKIVLSVPWFREEMFLVRFSAWRGKKPLVRALPAFPPNPSLFVSTPTWPCNIKAQHQPSGIVREWVVFDRLCYKGHILYKSKPRILTPNSEVHFVLLTGSFISLLSILLNFQSKVDRHNGS